MNGSGLAFHHVLIKLRRSPHRLARIDDEIQPVACGQQLPAEGFDAWRVPQVEAEDSSRLLQSSNPVRGNSARRNPGKSCGDNERRTCAQKFDAGLIADLDAASGQQRHSATQVGGFSSLHEVEFGTRRAKLIVKVMNRRIRLLADVAVLRLGGFAKIWILYIALFEVGGRKNVWCREEGLAPQFSNTGLRQGHFLACSFLEPYCGGAWP